MIHISPTTFLSNHIPLAKAVYGYSDIPKEDYENQYSTHKDNRHNNLYNNEEFLDEGDMAELIVIDIKPFTNAPEIQGLLRAEIILDSPVLEETTQKKEVEDCE